MKRIIRGVQENSFIKAFFNAYQSSEISMTSIAVAYYFLISIFPLLLIISNILPFFQIQIVSLLSLLQDLLPDSIYQQIISLASAVLDRPSTGLLSVSILSALWTFSQTMTYLQKAFNKVYGIEKGRGIIWTRLFSFLFSLSLQILFIFSLLLALFGRMVLTFIYSTWQFNDQLYNYLMNLTGPLVYLLLFAILVLLYYFLPDVKIRRIRYVVLGATFVVLVLFLITNVFSASIEAYMTRFLDARFLSSVLVFAVMFWFILLSKILILGAILNFACQMYFHKKTSSE